MEEPGPALGLKGLPGESSVVVSVCLTLAVCPAPMGEPSHESFPSTPPWPCGLGVPSPPTSNGAKMWAFLPHRAWLPQCPKHQPLWSSLRRARPRGAEAPCSVDHRTQGPRVPVPMPDAPAPGDHPGRARCYVSSTVPLLADARGTSSSLPDLGGSSQLPEPQRVGGRIWGDEICKMPAP